ncbi:precorrin-6A/cobalt-precorrin-6A reductase [Roseobacter ponti]|uniref:Precorrin-6A/cobalt-precorrin-6A reductase n=1 Tax=Roseobacter ponti TaxID=1891787 RepID=A0A858STT2_9RHOB|nr:precorrin-6A/cobalt-precorrin-6A reductase [Roseobacter ponti]QJF50951.1 precorrin-6A/cobalt-precorrin-6A reductase [Roseobacter ponti]
MKHGGTTLVLAGAREAHGVVAGLAESGETVIASLPEPERGVPPLPVSVRQGRFSGEDEMRAWMGAQDVRRVLDASHSFDDDISNMAAEICRADGMPYLRILRDGWMHTAADRWSRFATISEAVRTVPQDARIFSNTGFGSLRHYADFPGQRLFLRQTGQAEATPPWPFVTIVAGQPPFSEAQERDLFTELAITGLICRDVGGPASFSKLAAARALGLPVLMINRPDPPPDVTLASTVAEALAWQAACPT